jgi:hypothetical protein
MNCPDPHKERFTKSEAKRAVRDMKSRAHRSKHNMKPMEAYQCQCGAYHLVGRSRAKRRMI